MLVSQIGEEGLGPLAIEEGVQGVPARFPQQHVLGFMLFEHVEDHLGAPLDFPHRFFRSEVVAVHHQPGLGRIAEVVFEEIGFVQRSQEVFLKTFRG